MREKNIPQTVELGCGRKKPKDSYGVDRIETEAVDLVQDLDKKNWSLPSDHFSKIRAIDVFEHITNPNSFLKEVWRIGMDGSLVTIRGPHMSSGNWHDPTHKRLLGSRTFENYTGEGRFEYYSDFKFTMENIEITFGWQNYPFDRIGYWISNNYTWRYEKSFIRNILPATNITFKMTIRK